MLCHFLVASPTVLLPPLLLAIAVPIFATTIAHLFSGGYLAAVVPL